IILIKNKLTPQIKHPGESDHQHQAIFSKEWCRFKVNHLTTREMFSLGNRTMKSYCATCRFSDTSSGSSAKNK
ncbi:MAG: hypothetical protein L0H10_10470, partial [Comamonas sp.]|nr:hypothetical protein [Comamonas sp.]